MRLSRQFQFFLRKYFERTKTQIKPKPTNKTKTSEQKTKKGTIFNAQKASKRKKIIYFVFL